MKPIDVNNGQRPAQNVGSSAKRISFARKIVCQEILPNGTSHIVVEPCPDVSVDGPILTDAKTDEMSESMSSNDMSIDPMNATCHIDYNSDDSEYTSADDTPLNESEEPGRDSRPSTDFTMGGAIMNRTKNVLSTNESISSNNSSDKEDTSDRKSVV